jgi:hypothetical protein
MPLLVDAAETVRAPRRSANDVLLSGTSKGA